MIPLFQPLAMAMGALGPSKILLSDARVKEVIATLSRRQVGIGTPRAAETVAIGAGSRLCP